LINAVLWLIGTLIVVLGPIILAHELGHFILAKIAGVRVEEFGFGFPPRLLKLWHGKGYLDIGSTRIVIPLGFRLPSKLLVGAEVEAFAQQRDDDTYVLRRVTTLDSTRDDVTPSHERVSEKEIRIRGEVTDVERGTLYSLNWLPMGAFVKMTGEEDPSDPRSLAAQPKRWRLAVLAAGAVLNIIVALMLLVGAYVSGLPEKWEVQVTDVEPGTAAEEAGIQPRDIILAVDEEPIEEGTIHLQRIIRAKPEQTIELTVLRGDERLTLTATPRRSGEGYGFLGIHMNSWPDHTSLRRYSLPEATGASASELARIIVTIVKIPTMLIHGDVTPEEARPTSMVGIGELLTFTLQQSVEWGLPFPVLQTASFISLALGLTNLLPIPAFDGGRILFVLIEAVRGRRISPEREAMVHFVGLVILVSLSALVMLYDIANPIIPWSWLAR
jgi:regulator of sigma E protease